VKAHIGIPGNDRVGQLVKETQENARKIYKFYPQSFAKRVLRMKSIEKWNQRWIETTKGEITHQFLPTVYSRISAKHFKTDFVITQYLTNHGKFNQYLKRFKVVDSPLCDCDYRSQDEVNHRIFMCNKYLEQRYRLESVAIEIGIEFKLENIIKNKELFIEFANLIHTIHKKSSEQLTFITLVHLI
jgi:hypothetical protein